MSSDDKATMTWPNGKKYRFNDSDKPLNLFVNGPEGPVVHRGDCHGDSSNRPVLPEEVLQTLWDGAWVAAFRGQRHRVHFCDRVWREVK